MDNSKNNNQNNTNNNNFQPTQTQSNEHVDNNNNENSIIWGKLVPCNPEASHLDLIDNQIIFGRNPNKCNIVITDPTISGIHCKIIRDHINGGNALNNSGNSTSINIRITDLSTNGTFVKGQILGKDKTTILLNGDLISFTSANFHSSLSYIFQDLSIPDQGDEDFEFSKHYSIQGILGTGSFSVVKRCIKKDTGESFAVKIIDKRKHWQNPNKSQTSSEISILKMIKHPNIISIVEIFESEKYLYIVLELATGGELYDQIRIKHRYSEPEGKMIFKQVLSAVSYLHHLNIAHRDIKPENILINGKTETGDTIVKITDFGLAKIIGEKEYTKSLCGTPLYVAPEIVRSCFIDTTNNENNGGKGTAQPIGYGKEVDAWSLGCVLYIMLSGIPPFSVQGVAEIYHKNKEVSFDHKIWTTVTDQAKDLIKRFLQMEPKLRIPVKEALQHPWFNDELYRANTFQQQNSPNLDKKQAIYTHHVVQLPLETSPNKSFRLNNNNNNNSNNNKSKGGILQFDISPPKPNSSISKRSSKSPTSKKPATLQFQKLSPKQPSTTTTTNTTNKHIPFDLGKNLSSASNNKDNQEIIIHSSPEVQNEDTIDDEVEIDSKKRKKSHQPTNNTNNNKAIIKKLKAST